MAENAKKSFNRGHIWKHGEGKAAGSLHLFVSNDRENKKSVEKTTRKVGPEQRDAEVLNIAAYGFFAGPSGIAHSLGDGILKENGAVNVDIAVWGVKVGFTERLNLKPGDLIEVYADDWHKEERNGYVSLRTNNAEKVELERRKKTDSAVPADDVPAAPAAPEVPEEDDQNVDITWD